MRLSPVPHQAISPMARPKMRNTVKVNLLLQPHVKRLGFRRAKALDLSLSRHVERLILADVVQADAQPQGAAN